MQNDSKQGGYGILKLEYTKGVINDVFEIQLTTTE